MAKQSTKKSRTIFIRFWQRLCRNIVSIFYRRFEVSGLENIPPDSGIILCANHVNALVDPVVLQASTSLVIRPLARSGLFKNPLLKPIMETIGAVPIFRRGDPGSDTARNVDSFSRCYELLAKNETLIIFPEGQSHSDPHLHDLKTGAARMALGAIETNNKTPVVIPAGLTFTRKGTFRSDVLVQFGKPVDLEIPSDTGQRDAIRLLTKRIADGLSNVTLNAESWQDIDLVDRLERFFAFRHGKYRQRDLTTRFRTLQRLIDGQRLLRHHDPNRVRSIINQLRMFERLCNTCGIKDYHLTVEYKPVLVAIYIIRTLAMLFLIFPIALWGIFNSVIPFYLTRFLSRRFAKGTDQYDTTKIVLGFTFFLLFWSIQCFFVCYHFGLSWMLLYLISVIIGVAVALAIRGENKRIRENIKVFFLFARKRQLREFLETKRHDLEVELARLVRIAKRLPQTDPIED